MSHLVNTLLCPGLVSITFRKLSVDQIIPLCVATGLVGIEWGGDVHVPPTDLANAQKVGEATNAAGLSVYAYGSYFRVGSKKQNPTPFSDVLAAASALRTSIIRVWAGDVNSQDATPDQWDTVTSELKTLCAEAAQQGLRLGMEFHDGTLNNTADSSRRIIETVNAENLSSFWQTTNRAPDAISLESLRKMRDWISQIHIFNWHTGGSDQTPLAEGQDRWSKFLKEIATLPGEHFLGLEFVKDGLESQLKDDAQTLRTWLADLKATN